MTPTEVRLALRAAGFHPIPLNGKRPQLSEWPTKIDAPPEEIKRWALTFPRSTNTGCLTVDMPTLDLDITIEPAATAVEELVRDWFDGRGAILVRIGNPPKRAMPFRTDTPFTKMTRFFLAPDRSEHKAEFLGDGQQVVITGSHPDTRKPYAWCGGYAPGVIPWRDLPEIDAAEAENLLNFIAEMLAEKFGFREREHEPQADSTAGAPGGGPLDVDAALAAMQPNGASVNDTQSRVILSLLQRAIHPADVITRIVDATIELADRAGLGWSREKEERKVYERVKCDLNKLTAEHRVGAGGIPPWLAGEFHAEWWEVLQRGKQPQLLRNHSGWYVRARPRYVPTHANQYGRNLGPHGDGGKAARGNADNTRAESAAKQETRDQAEPPRRERFRLIPFCELRPGTDPLYRVDELIPMRGLVDVWGKAKCCKSFWTYDLCFHIAQGWVYRDRYVQQGTVVYCAFEGAHGYRNRGEALRRHYGIAADDSIPLYLIAESTNLIVEHALLVDAIRRSGNNPAVVVLDTLNKSLVGSENKDVDMGAYVRAAEAIRDAFDCVVIIVHHCGWDDTRPRGHSSLPAAVDAQLAITRSESIITVTVEMMRDGPEETQIVSEVVSVDVGSDKNGKVLTSLVVVPTDADPASRDRQGWPRGLSVLHTCLKFVLASHGEMFQPEAGVLPVQAVDQIWVRERFYKAYAELEDDPKKRTAKLRKAFQRAVTDGQARGVIRVLRTEADRMMLWFPERSTQQ
jgi:AAA domain/Bifunctional DNA primase/polymerase, N-terminal